MLKYHVAVCDDEKSDLDGIVQSVQQYDVQGCFDIETYMDGNELLSELQMQKKSFDLLLLDIEMPSNGFQLAQSLIQMEKHPLVVFVTKRHEYAVQGYGIAFRYLVKPLDQTLFAAAMDAVLQELNSKHFTIEYDGVTMSLETSDIVQMSLLKSCIQRHWKCWNLPALNLSLKKRNPFPCPRHKQKNSGAIMCRTSL